MPSCAQSAQHAQLLHQGPATRCQRRSQGFCTGQMAKERRSCFERGLLPRKGRVEVVLEQWALHNPWRG